MNLNKIINNNYFIVCVLLILCAIVFFIIYYLYNKKNKYIKNKFYDVKPIKYLDIIPNYTGYSTVGKSIDDNGNIIWYGFGDNEYNSLGIDTNDDIIIEPTEFATINKIYDIKLFYEISFIKYVINNINKWIFNGNSIYSGIDFTAPNAVDTYVMKYNPLLDNSIDIIGSDTLFYAKKINSEGEINWYVFGDDYLYLMGFDTNKLFDNYYNPLPTTPITTNPDYIIYDGEPLYNKKLDNMVDIKASWENFFYGKKIDENNNIKWYVWGDYDYCGINYNSLEEKYQISEYSGINSVNGEPVYNPLLDNFIDILVTGEYTIGKKIINNEIQWFFWDNTILIPTHITEFDIYSEIIINDNMHFGLNKTDNQWYYWESIPDYLTTQPSTTNFNFNYNYTFEYTYEYLKTGINTIPTSTNINSNKPLNISLEIINLQSSENLTTTTTNISTEPKINPSLTIKLGYEYGFILDTTHNKWYCFGYSRYGQLSPGRENADDGYIHVIEKYADFIPIPTTTLPTTTLPTTTLPTTTLPTTTLPTTTLPTTTLPTTTSYSLITNTNQYESLIPESNDFNIGMMLKGNYNEGNLNDFLSENTMSGTNFYISPLNQNSFNNDDFLNNMYI